MKPIIKILLWLTAFSIAMGYLETSVVVYLRKVYYPGGFKFPLVPIEQEIAVTEFWREVATLIMLLSVGIISGKNTAQRFVFFIYCFAIWDLFYYVFLQLLLGWPGNLFTWDILFLIPIPWVGPVIAPCIISITMIALTFGVVYYSEKGFNVVILFREWALLILGSLVCMISFMWDYVNYVYTKNPTEKIWSLTNKKGMFHEIESYVPDHFNWGMFLFGEILLALAIALFLYRMRIHPYAKTK